MITGPFTIVWKRRLAQHARREDIPIPGGFNAATPRWGKHAQELARAVKAKAGQPNPDGKLDAFLRELVTQRSIGEKAVAFAEACAKDAGWKETSRNKGPRINAMKQALNGFVDDAPWCADFYTWCARHAGWNVPGLRSFNHRYCPAWLDAALREEHGIHLVKGKVLRGDGALFDWDKDGTMDHIGRVSRTLGPLVQIRYVNSVDGNTGGDPADPSGLGSGDAVHRRTRLKSQVPYFIRETNQPGVYGIDVSNHQRDVDWKQVAKNPRPVRFAFAKVSEGASFADAWWEKNRAGATRVGIPIGGYCFVASRNVADAKVEAERFCRLLGKTPLLPVVDWEGDGASDPAQRKTLEAFVRTVQLRTGVLPILYAGAYVLRDLKVPKTSILAKCILWVPAYPTLPFIPQPWTRVAIHQFSESGQVRGVATRCDENRLIVPLSALKWEKQS